MPSEKGSLFYMKDSGFKRPDKENDLKMMVLTSELVGCK